ncbi:hypothetical protein B0H13DRAFT_240133 [Mycena leptocephala]|nr:hypothetical protein B0H13DRAFT_240133 [Mycena leptocephala]
MQTLGFSVAPRLSAAFQGPNKTLAEIARLSAAPFGADSTLALGTLISLLLIAGTLVFMLRKRAVALMNRFIGWIIRTEAAAILLLILLVAFVVWRPRFCRRFGPPHIPPADLFSSHIHGLDDRPRSSVLHSLVAR